MVGATGITQIAFTSPLQTVEPSVASSRITIEAQDAADIAVRGSTVCLSVTSSSQSGEFSTNATSWSAEPVRSLALTISSNQYRRNYYYRDKSEGIFTLSVRAGLRAQGSTCSAWKGEPTWSATQQITIDKNAAAIVAAHERESATTAALAAPKTESKASTPTTKKKTSTFVSKSVTEDDVEPTAADSQGASSAPVPPLAPSQVAAASLFSDSLWWVAALGLVGAGCLAIVLSKKSASKEWDVIEEKGD